MKPQVFISGLASVLALAGACSTRRSEPVVSSRYQAVKSAVDPSARWCDVSFAGEAKALTLPPLASGGGLLPLALPKGKRVWVNLWATWCKPCLRELPLLLQWQSDLGKDGVDVEPLFLSLDEDAEVLSKFLAEYKEIPAGRVARASSEQDYQQWMKGYLKDPSTPIPIHLLASSDGHLRCIRSGSLREGDYPAAKAALH